MEFDLRPATGGHRIVTRYLLATIAILALANPASAQGQPEPVPPTAAQQRHEELTMRQSLQRLDDAEKNLDKAIGQLKQAPVEPGAPASPAQPAAVSPQSAAIQQAEQALSDVRRAVDEIAIPQGRRQGVLDKLDDADSAMRMARQPEEADARRMKLEEALRRVQSEVRTAKEEGPAKKAD
jgi:hypothetical protein